MNTLKDRKQQYRPRFWTDKILKKWQGSSDMALFKGSVREKWKGV